MTDGKSTEDKGSKDEENEMGVDHRFRKCMFGGYNKEDVETYVKSVSDEIGSLKERIDAMEHDREMTVRVLKDAYYNAEAMISSAEKTAKGIVQKADKEAEERRSRSLQRLQEEMGQKALEFVTVKYRISDYVKQIDEVRGSLESLSGQLRQVLQEMPAKVRDIIGESEEKHFIDAEYQKPSDE